MDVVAGAPIPVVHRELHSGDRARAAAFYDHLLRRTPEPIDVRPGPDHALGPR